MHKPESILENKMYKILWDIDIQTNHKISARKPVPVLIKKKIKLLYFVIQVDQRVKMKKSEKIDKYLDLARELKKLWNVKVIPIVIGTLRKVLKP